jgi:hypothetical protein
MNLRHPASHGSQAIGHHLRPSHETCTELAALHSVARTTHVDIDLVVAELGTPARRLRHQTGIAATDLQRDRVFRNVKFE